MRSLRSLCLLKVQSLALGQQMLDKTEIPPSLAKDLKIMQLVNTSFEILCRDRFCGRDNVTQTALSIQSVRWSLLEFLLPYAYQLQTAVYLGGGEVNPYPVSFLGGF